jgi:DNA-binding response OmpR family regulator
MGLTEPREAGPRGRPEADPAGRARNGEPASENRRKGHEEVLAIANLEVRPAEFQLLADGKRVGLTVREFQTFLVLAERPDRVVTRPEIYSLVWGGQMTYRDRSVDVFVRKVRRKLDAAAPGWVYIHTHFGVGYRFSPERVTSP